MASTKNESDALHKADITNGGVALLTQVLPAQQWYKDKPMKIGLAGNDLNERLSAVKKADDSASAEEQDEWADQPYTLEMNENEREAAKACVQFFWKQGAFNLSKHIAKLIHVLGLDEA